MDLIIDQKVALDEALVPHVSRLKIRKSNFQLRSDLKSKESTLQVVYDVLKLTLFYKAFLVTADQFHKLPFEEEILAFLKELGHSGEIKMIIDVNINKLHQPWRSFAAVINKCLSGKSTDFVYQVEHKDAKTSNEMYYPRFTKVIVNFFMTKDQSIPSKNKINWHYARDDHMFTTIELVSRHQNTQHYGVILLFELTNEDIRNFKSYKEYYAIASGAKPPKTKASVRKKQSSFDTIVPPLTKGKRLKTSAKVDKPAKEKQPAKSYTAKSLNVLSEVALTEAEQINDRMNVEGDEGANEEDDADELYRDVNINLEGRDIQMADVQTTQVIKNTHVTLTLVNLEGQQ
nr:hypothetical protein [Tanacetum cinerariifolium]